MEFETVFEYCHKKFGKRQRSADEDSDSKLNQQTAVDTLGQIQDKRPKMETAAGDIKFIAEVEPCSSRASQEEIEVIDLSFESQTESSTDVMVSSEEEEKCRTPSSPNSTFGSISPVDRHSEEVQVKAESPIRPQPTGVVTRRMRRSSNRPTRFQSNTPDTAISSSAPSDLISVKIKEELIEINTTIKEKIPEETFEDICRFHENMVRRFPKKERSPKEQDRRNKNTVACRKSRRVRKLSAALEETDYKNKYDLYKDQMRECFVLEKYSQFVMGLAKTESEVIVVD